MMDASMIKPNTMLRVMERKRKTISLFFCIEMHIMMSVLARVSRHRQM